MRKRKSWREKLADDKGLPRVEKITARMSGRWGKGTVVIPAPREVNALMQRVPAGKLTTINEIRSALAKKHEATIGCPITSGIFAWIAAHAAAEAAAAGDKSITPYWRTLKSGGELNPKYPGGIPALRKLLTAEGHRVVKRGQKYFVAELQPVLATFL
jgi:alkylated DNA nucleotide flippase Atl1